MQKTREELFLDKVHKTASCWLWVGSICKDGYGKFSSEAGSLAHRFSYTQYIGEIPKGLQLDHLCRNRCCVNPLHLEVVTSQENTNRGLRRKRDFCIHGHALDDMNTYRWTAPGGWEQRTCRTCNRLIKRRTTK